MDILFRHNWQHSVGVLISIWVLVGFGHLDYFVVLRYPENMSVFAVEGELLCHRYALVCTASIRSFLPHALHQHNFNNRHLDPIAHRTLASTFHPQNTVGDRAPTPAPAYARPSLPHIYFTLIAPSLSHLQVSHSHLHIFKIHPACTTQPSQSRRTSTHELHRISLGCFAIHSMRACLLFCVTPGQPATTLKYARQTTDSVVGIKG